MKDFYDFNLKEHNTFGIDVKCRRFIEFESVDELLQIVNSLTDADKPLLVLGGGSNMLFTADYEGTVLHSAIKGHVAVQTDEGIMLRCGSGEVWDDIVSLCVSNRMYGAENLSLIPGDVGASAVQNIGAYGAEAKDIILKVEAVDLQTGKMCEFTNEECEYAYRKSKFKGEWRTRFVITYVTYKLSEVFCPCLDYGNIRAELEKRNIKVPTAEQLRNVIIDIRNEKLPDPKIEGNAGSFFMNPVVPKAKYEELVARLGNVPHYSVDDNNEKIPAGWMIDQCGWKGKSLGKAGVHSRQALVLVNRGGAEGKDIVALCDAIKRDVKDKFGIDIVPEVNII
ncbi:uDP-N-acetylenolpyruvoylglucosamine reductase [Prevotella sp. CAG:255]|uniref:UDP-N-acetylmuramate dehydrogenase n=1 Tax=Prevotella sp. CAG:255 TaxID=1262923 RepID=UPI000335D9F3|nr:UDP-N-acetylmuramate dehydrogenase [Prevotella sp. CAG:255]CCX69333.1 uDP-N-acetylenolpyruvoylglucosamine reductase [Prevotella sp. CAG:255]